MATADTKLVDVGSGSFASKHLSPLSNQDGHGHPGIRRCVPLADIAARRTQRTRASMVRRQGRTEETAPARGRIRECFDCVDVDLAFEPRSTSWGCQGSIWQPCFAQTLSKPVEVIGSAQRHQVLQTRNTDLRCKLAQTHHRLLGFLHTTGERIARGCRA
jgi:hypothetical protein